MMIEKKNEAEGNWKEWVEEVETVTICGGGFSANHVVMSTFSDAHLIK